jgi:hypothetical protein
VACMLALPVCGVRSPAASATNNPAPVRTAGKPAAGSPTAAELIEKLGATQDKLWTSFVVRMESSSTFGGKDRERPQFRPGEWHQTIETWEYRSDGERGYDHSTRLRDGLLSGANDMKSPGNNYSLWDGKTSYGYTYALGSFARNSGPYGMEGTVQISYSKPHSSNGRATTGRTTITRSIMGSFYGAASEDSIADELRRATDITVKPTTETINGLDCYVVTASGGGSDYQVWIDPAHDYNVAKAIIRRNWTSFSPPQGYSKPPPAGYQTMQLILSGFQSLDGVWLAKEADWHHEKHCQNADYTVENIHIKITKYARNPDHEKLGSFKPTFIREGAVVHVEGKSALYIWQRGTLVQEQIKNR